MKLFSKANGLKVLAGAAAALMVTIGFSATAANAAGFVPDSVGIQSWIEDEGCLNDVWGTVDFDGVEEGDVVEVAVTDGATTVWGAPSESGNWLIFFDVFPNPGSVTLSYQLYINEEPVEGASGELFGGCSPFPADLDLRWDPNPANNVCPATTGSSLITGGLGGDWDEREREIILISGPYDPEVGIEEQSIVASAPLEIDPEDGSFSYLAENLPAGVYTALVVEDIEGVWVLDGEVLQVIISPCEPTKPAKIETAAA